MTDNTTRVIVGVSGSLAGLAALRTAVAEARLRNADLIAVRAWAFKASWRESGTRIWRQEIANQAAHILADAFDTAMGGPPRDLNVQMLVAEGLPERVLVERADRVDDLLVIGAPAGGFWRPTRTIVVRFCARHAHCRLMVVPPPELARLGKTAAMARHLRREADGITRSLSRH
jgi:nucleotide-binding universal stress UspA family protein